MKADERVLLYAYNSMENAFSTKTSNSTVHQKASEMSESDVCRHQILTSEVDPRTVGPPKN